MIKIVHQYKPANKIVSLVNSNLFSNNNNNIKKQSQHSLFSILLQNQRLLPFLKMEFRLTQTFLKSQIFFLSGIIYVLREYIKG
jgi:hypothetical protein